MSWPAAPPTMPHMASGLFLRGLPPRNGNLARPRHGELPGGRVLIDSRAGADIRAAGNAYRRHQRGVGTDEAIVFDHGAMLVDAVVIARDRPGADVDAGAYFRVADVGEMVRFRATAQAACLHLHEVADMDFVGQVGA